jgi:hypothetical protein
MRAWALTTLLSLSLVGCAGPDSGSGRVAEPEARPSACADAAGCRVVAGVDVDGDDRADEVGFVVESRKRATLRLATSGGQTLRHRLRVTWFPEPEFFGAAPIDGRPGAELVVGTTMGAHTLFFSTLSVRDGEIVRVPAPAGPEWMIDGAFAFHAGVVRRIEDGRVTVVLREAARQGQSPRFAGTDRTYVWRDGGWRHLRSERTRYRTEEAASRVGGWHVPGLPRRPDF